MLAEGKEQIFEDMLSFPLFPFPSYSTGASEKRR